MKASRGGAPAARVDRATVRPAERADLAAVAAWIGSAHDAALWAGERVGFPVALETLADAIEWEASERWAVTSDGALVAFGQLVPKPDGRRHLARLIVAPDRRGDGLGRLIASHLVDRAVASGAAALSLNVQADNPAAIALYGSLGFESAERPPGEPPSDALFMLRTVRPMRP